MNFIHIISILTLFTIIRIKGKILQNWEVEKISKIEIKNEASKYTTYKKEVENVVNKLNTMRSRVNENFEGRTEDEMIESINLLVNMSRNLGEELVQVKVSLNDLYEDVLQEERRQERIRREKEEAKRKAENNN